MRNGRCSFNRSLSTLLYLKTLKCIDTYNYYNHSTGLCQDECGLYFYGVYGEVDKI